MLALLMGLRLSPVLGLGLSCGAQASDPRGPSIDALVFKVLYESVGDCAIIRLWDAG